jgi:hypothetical protein
MCDVATQQLMEQVVRQKLRAGEMFTAFDISMEAKRRGSTERHRHMKHVVHQFFARGDMGNDYTRTLVAIPGAPAKAWLYHPDSANLKDYPPLHKKTRGGTHGYPVDRRSRLCVPVQWLRRAGFRPGDAAFVTMDSRSGSLVVSRSCRRKPLRAYRVDRNGNVRIAQTTLRRASLAGQAFDIAGDKSKVTLRLLGTPASAASTKHGVP